MPVKPEDFSKFRQEWSRWKHEILDRYLKAFSGILQRHSTIFVVDGFAGPGYYIDNEQPGSPLLAARQAAGLENKRSYRLRCINVEQNEAVFENLVEYTRPFSKYVTNLCGDFLDYVATIMEQIGDQPTLFFLDPCGVKDMKWEKLKPVFERGQHNDTPVTELLIRFGANHIARVAGSARKRNHPGSEANARLLVEYYGFKEMVQLDRFLGDYEVTEDGFTKAYQDRLRDHFNYTVNIPIREAAGTLKYYLIFATRSLKGIQAMNDTLYQVEGIRETELSSLLPPSPSLPTLFDLEELDRKADERKLLYELNTLKETVLNILPDDRRIRRDDLRAEVALKEDYFGQFSGSHFTAVLGGRPKGIKLPKDFTPLKHGEQIRLESRAPGAKAKPGDDKTYIRKL